MCVFRYGLKGAVYLKNREGQVVSVADDGGCVWQVGTLQRYPDRISSCTSTGSNTFHLFDHVTVSTHTPVNFVPVNLKSCV